MRLCKAMIRSAEISVPFILWTYQTVLIVSVIWFNSE